MLPMFFGHHKCATTWIISILGTLAGKANLKHGHFHSHKTMGFNLEQAIRRSGIDICSCTNARYSQINIQDFRGFHIIRDPRDIFVFAYFSHLKSHETQYWPELVAHRETLRSMPKDAGLLFSFEFSDRLPTDGCDIELMKSLAEWNYADERILELKFEHVIAQPYESLVRAAEHIGLTRKPKTPKQSRSGKLRSRVTLRKTSRPAALRIDDVLRAVYDNRFEKMAGGRTVGSENVTNHYRKGQPGDWVNHFKAEHKAAFKQRYPGLLQQLGYETDDNW